MDVLSHSCWAISHLCDGHTSTNFIKRTVDTSICKQLITLLTHKSLKVVKPALRAIGNIVCVEDEVRMNSFKCADLGL